MLKVFCAPARYTQGPHATEQLGAEIRPLGLEEPAFLVARRSGKALSEGSMTRSEPMILVRF